MPLQPQDLRGMFVRDRDGAPVGTVEDLYVDRPTGEIRYIGVSNFSLEQIEGLIDTALRRIDEASQARAS